MRLSKMLKKGAIGAYLRGRRHQGRHRGTPTSVEQTSSGWANVVDGERQTPNMSHPGTETAVQDFYVVSPHVPALTDSLAS
jgi:hypothetical protein